MKLQDVSVLYHGFRDYLKDHYMTAEEVLENPGKANRFFRKTEGQCSAAGWIYRFYTDTDPGNPGAADIM